MLQFFSHIWRPKTDRTFHFVNQSAIILFLWTSEKWRGHIQPPLSAQHLIESLSSFLLQMIWFTFYFLFCLLQGLKLKKIKSLLCMICLSVCVCVCVLNELYSWRLWWLSNINSCSGYKMKIASALTLDINVLKLMTSFLVYLRFLSVVVSSVFFLWRQECHYTRALTECVYLDFEADQGQVLSITDRSCNRSMAF